MNAVFEFYAKYLNEEFYKALPAEEEGYPTTVNAANAVFDEANER